MKKKKIAFPFLSHPFPPTPSPPSPFPPTKRFFFGLPYCLFHPFLFSKHTPTEPPRHYQPVQVEEEAQHVECQLDLILLRVRLELQRIGDVANVENARGAHRGAFGIALDW